MSDFITSFIISFCVSLYFILIGGLIAAEQTQKPEWYGDYYCLADAMEDGWYEGK